jgi:hypothetical protein
MDTFVNPQRRRALLVLLVTSAVVPCSAKTQEQRPEPRSAPTAEQSCAGMALAIASPLPLFGHNYPIRNTSLLVSIRLSGAKSNVTGADHGTNVSFAGGICRPIHGHGACFGNRRR